MFTAQKRPWTFGLEGVYMKLEGEGAHTVTGPDGIESRNGSLDVTNTMYIFQGSVDYRLLDDKTKLNAIGAFRYTEMKMEMDVAVAFDPPALCGARSADGSDSWTDFVIGMHARHPVSDKAPVTTGNEKLSWDSTNKTFGYHAERFKFRMHTTT